MICLYEFVQDYLVNHSNIYYTYDSRKEVRDISKQFLLNYVGDMYNHVMLAYPNADDDKVKKYILNAVQERIKDPEIEYTNNYTNESRLTRFSEVLTDYFENGKILSGNGVLYEPPSIKTSNSNKMIDALIEERSRYKATMLERLAEGDMDGFQRFNRQQAVTKILNNSFYGVTGMKGSQFYNPYVAESTTYTGVQIITTCIMQFEMLLSNNIKFHSLDELMSFILRVRKEEYDNDILPILDNVKDKDSVYEYLLGLCDWDVSDSDRDILDRVLNNCSEELLNRIYYKNNLYKYIENPQIWNMVKLLLEKPVINLKEDISDDLQLVVDTLWNFYKDHICYLYQVPNRYLRASTMTRKSVIIVDTDSNFLTLDKYVNVLKDNMGKVSLSDDEKFTYANSILVFIAKYIEAFLWKMTGSANMPEETRILIKMDNEYFYTRLVNTKNKKSYVGLLALQEGVRIEPKKVDMKGLTIKKSNTPQLTEKFFTDLIYDDILTPERINIKEILAKYSEFETTIKNSLLSGSTEYLTPARVNDVSSYKNPYSIMGVRGVLTFNYMFPNEALSFPAEISILKLTGATLQDLEPLFHTEYFDIIKERIFEHKDEGFSKFGFTTIALPRSMDKIPEFLIPLIDIPTIVDDNVKSGLILLESLGLSILEVGNYKSYSNIINF